MIEGLPGKPFDGLMCIGYHSAAGEFGVLAHTINGRAFARVTINNKVMSEADIYAAAAAEYQTPLWLVSGDDQLQSWIQHYYPSAEYVCVKQYISHTAANALSPQAACDAIRTAAIHAVHKANRTPTTRLAAPYQLALTASKPVLADLFALIPGVTRINAVNVGFQAATMKDIIRLLSTFSYLASTQN